MRANVCVIYWHLSAIVCGETIHGITLTYGFRILHYNGIMMSAMASQITNLTTVYPSVYSGTDQRKHQSSASLAFVWGINRWPVNSPHKGPVMRKIFPFDDVIMTERWVMDGSSRYWWPCMYGGRLKCIFIVAISHLLLLFRVIA